MKANELISSSIIHLHPYDSGDRAIEMMEEMKVYHLPVVRNNFYLGILSESEILSWDSPSEFIHEHLDELSSPSIQETQHLFDIIEIVEKNSISIIPVLDEKNLYLGSITNRKLLYTIAKSTVIKSNGSVIVLNIKNTDYSMYEISKIIESNNAKILSSYVTSTPEMEYIDVTIKLNTMETNSIIKDLKRFDYNIIASYEQKDNQDDFIDRYESLMRFINI